MKDVKCIVCGKELDKKSKYSICDECLQKMPFISGKVCKCCGEPIKSLAQYCMKCKSHVDRGFDKARAVFLYDKMPSKLVKDLKFFNKRYLAIYLSEFLLDKYNFENFDCDFVVPTPASKKSIKKRGFNQAVLLCQAFKNAGYEVKEDCVQKTSETRNQVGLNYKDRQTNLIGAFGVKNPNEVKGKNILLIDDIFTTGATVSEISETLKKAGANKVFVLTVCHEMPKKATN